MRELHLFAGIGGGILSGKLLGHRCVGAVEINAYCRQVLKARQREGILESFPILEDVCAFDGKPWRGKVDVVCGGFPCTPWSTAGKRLGTADPRHLWPEMARIVSEVRPAYVFAENVSLAAFEQPWRDLRGMGYRVPPALCLGASHVGAPHRRLRWWMLAADADRKQHEGGAHAIGRAGTEELSDVPDADSDGLHELGAGQYVSGAGRGSSPTWSDGGEGHVADAAGARRTEGLRESGRAIRHAARGSEPKRLGDEVANADLQRLAQRQGERGDHGEELAPAVGSGLGHADGQRQLQPQGRVGTQRGRTGHAGWWATEPRVGRVAHGIPSRVEQLKALGNAQVPAVAAAAFRILLEREMSSR